MFIAMNRFKVIKEERKAFKDLWVTRESHLDEVKGFRAFHLLRVRSATTMCSIRLIQYGRRKRLLRHGPSLNNPVPPINTLASASRSHSATRNSKGSKSSR
jgi:Antibiotic biosynthesis monooxygenase